MPGSGKICDLTRRAFVWGKGAQQIPPLRCASVGMTNLFGGKVETATGHSLDLKQICHPTEAQRSGGACLRPGPKQNPAKTWPSNKFVIPTEAQRSGGACLRPGPKQNPAKTWPSNKFVIPTEAQRSGGARLRPGPKQNPAKTWPSNKFVIPTEAQRSGGACLRPGPQTKPSQDVAFKQICHPDRSEA
jgi:hypothetical protein